MSTSLHDLQHVSLPKVLIGGAVAGVASLLLQAGQASALTTPCSFGGNVEAAGCTKGPYDSDLPSDKIITLLSTNQDGTTQGPTTGQGTVDFDWIPLPPPGYGADLWEVDVDFDADLVGPGSGSFDYGISIIDPSRTFDRVRLKVDALAGNPTVTKSIYTDDAFTNKILELTGNGFISLPSGYQTLYVRDSYTLQQGDVLASFQNVYTQQTVPGPLPLLGAGTAFGFSRSLRRRLKQRHSLG
ncbi:MAG: hypothetical protein ACKOZW_11220 [Cyanobium sp.]